MFVVSHIFFVSNCSQNTMLMCNISVQYIKDLKKCSNEFVWKVEICGTNRNEIQCGHVTVWYSKERSIAHPGTIYQFLVCSLFYCHCLCVLCTILCFTDHVITKTTCMFLSKTLIGQNSLTCWCHNQTLLPPNRHLCLWCLRADSRFAPSQWDTMVLCNDASHWLGANLESALMSHLTI